MTARTFTTAQIAEKIGTTPRELRKFLRADASDKSTLPGKGARYALPGDAKTISAMKKRFAAWSAKQAEAREARKAAKELENTVPDVEDDEPTDAELDELADEAE